MSIKKAISILFIFSVIVPLAFAALECDVRTSCQADETAVFRFSDVGSGGEHVSIAGSGSAFPNIVCCKADAVTLSINDECTESGGFADEDIVLTVPTSQITNTHVASSIGGTFNRPRCLKVSSGTINCAFVSGDCDTGQECLATASSTSNAHVGDCSSDFPYTICCSTNGAVQGCNRDCSADGLCNVDCADDPFCSDDPDCCELECGAGDGCNSECETNLACPIDPDCSCPFQCDIFPCDAQCYYDPRCEAGTNCSVSPPSEICDNGLDDDLDGLTDCDDPDCDSDPACSGTVCIPSHEDCDNGIDDDCDNRIDCADLDCASAPNCSAVSDVFDVSLEISPASVDAGDTVTVTISVTVLNKSSSQHSAQISVSVEDNIFSIPSETISVPAGASATRDFTPTVSSGAAEKVYKVTASVPVFGSERSGNNTVVKSFIVGSAPQAISVPDMSLALVPFLAIIVLALIYRKK